MYYQLYFVPLYSFRRTCSIIFLPFFPSFVPSYFSAVNFRCYFLLYFPPLISAVSSAVYFCRLFRRYFFCWIFCITILLCLSNFMLLLYFPCTSEEMLVYCVACFFLLSKFYASAVLSMYFRRNVGFVCCFLLSACSSSMCKFLPNSIKSR